MNNSPEPIMRYLQALPKYPYNPIIDAEFAEELIIDFDAVDILDQLKAFRWYHDGNPAANTKNLRLSIRRWMANAKAHIEPF